MNRAAPLLLMIVLIGCEAPSQPTFSADKWKTMSATTEAELVDAFGPGSPAGEGAAKTLIDSYKLPENARLTQWTDPENSGVTYFAAIVDGQVVQKIEWGHSGNP